jgi:hypothetical protein
MRCSAAISIAANATLRSGTGDTPTATGSRSVHPSSADAMAIAPPQKQSSQSHSSASPDSSATWATSRSRSGGTWGQQVAARIVMTLSCRKPGSRQPASVPRGRRRLVSWAGLMVTGNGRSTVSCAVVTATVT